ncbi:MAG: methyltransferase domain-containing protein [Deltaproteobacteria bacterium]|nr:methyltransferase domain-containing protein [Deltaproteobacteria bacterium]
MRDTWNPEQYERFKRERAQPFHDLMSLVRWKPAMRVVDLGCGTGEFTRILHEKLGAAETLGIDNSDAMLKTCDKYATEGLRFEKRDISDFSADAAFDLVFSSAAIQWLPAHETLLAGIARAVAPEGQLAIHMPANDDHPSHTAAVDVASEAPFRDALRGYTHRPPLLSAERYAEIVDALGFSTQHVRLQVYVHRLLSRDSVVDWVKGTLLTDYERRLPKDLFAKFVERYRERLIPKLADKRPYLFTFRRLLFWATR